MKQCTKCLLDKPESEFGNRSASKDGLKFSCKQCERDQRREFYEANKDRIANENRRGHKKRKETFYSNIKEYVGSDVLTCSNTECGFSHEYMALFDWHHVDPKEKDLEISRMVRHSKEKLFKELDKCILLCSNCHRLLHYEENLKTQEV